MDRQEALISQLHIDRKGAPPKRRRWPWVLGLLVVAVVAFLMLSGGRPVSVEIAQARAAASDENASVLDASGYVTARRQATVSSKVTGKVREVLIEEGQRVAADEIVAYLDDTEAKTDEGLALARLHAVKTALGEIRATLADAEREFARQRDLAARQLISQAALDAATTQVEALRARLANAQAQIPVAERQLEATRNLLANMQVRAPFAGVVTVKAAQPGEMISPISAGGGFTRTGIGTIVDMESLEIQVDVNEAYINRVTSNQPVNAVLNAYPDWNIPASVIAIIPAADRTKATVKVRIALASKDARIVPDMGVRVSFLEEHKPGAPKREGVWVPTRAIAGVGKDAAVFVVGSDGKAKRVPVVLGDKRDADQLVTKGLKGGEAVVLGPFDQLRDGARVIAKNA
ncbi:MAG TPA: efflux RND transporter periplasmic adaptor subunit [Patescibacteria group bacterium]|nr:efflux RND transporter periplasmic adaptor subunit [Patescibacteria group bacterium]